MDKDTNTDTDIKRVITCGVRWGDSANSYKDLMIENGVCVLATSNRGIGTFLSIGDQDLIALKDGRNIIALGKRKLNSNIRKGNWNGFFDQYLEQKITYEQQEKKASYFAFSLDDTIAMIDIEEWLVLDTPIYYPVMQSTVTIQDEYVKQACIDTFNGKRITLEESIARQIDASLKNAQLLFSEYMVMPNTDTGKASLLEKLLGSIDIVLNYEPDNEIAKKMKESITEGGYLISTKSRELSNIFNSKARSLKWSNYIYIPLFILTLLTFIIIAACYVKTFDINIITKDNLIVYVVTKGFIISSIILSVFGIASFFNKRIRENVYLIEEYDYKALIFESLQNIKDVFDEKKTEEVFNSMINKIIENPAVNLLKVKDKKSDLTLKNIKEVAKILSKFKKLN